MNALLDTALEASGGLAAWQAVREVVVTGRLGGLVLGLTSEFDEDPVRELRIATDRPQVVFSRYPGDGRRGIFAGDEVRIESADGSQLLGFRRNPRRCFSSFPWSLRRRFYWDDLDVLYFTGYAVWNYFLTPYLLTFPGVETSEVAPDAEGRRTLAVVFPENFHTHSREQSFTFGDAGLLHHLRYTFELVGKWARVIHFCQDYRSFALPHGGNSIHVATVRRATLAGDVFLRWLRMRMAKRTLGMWGDIYNVELVS